VADDGEAIAEAARLLKPDLANQRVVKQVRFFAKNQRDCGAASAVGAATVAISLLIGDGKVTLDAFYVLLYAQVLLIFTAQIFATWATGLMGHARNPLLPTGLVLASAGIAAAGSYITSQLRQHESNAGSRAWWLLLGLAAVGALLGLIIRRAAESLLDELDDESWRQRVAPLVNEQEQAIAEMRRLGALLRDTPAAAARSGANVTSASPGSEHVHPAS
jgi:hypothetical protein